MQGSCFGHYFIISACGRFQGGQSGEFQFHSCHQNVSKKIVALYWMVASMHLYHTCTTYLLEISARVHVLLQAEAELKNGLHSRWCPIGVRLPTLAGLWKQWQRRGFHFLKTAKLRVLRASKNLVVSAICLAWHNLPLEQKFRLPFGHFLEESSGIWRLQNNPSACVGFGPRVVRMQSLNKIPRARSTYPPWLFFLRHALSLQYWTNINRNYHNILAKTSTFLIHYSIIIVELHDSPPYTWHHFKQSQFEFGKVTTTKKKQRVISHNNITSSHNTIASYAHYYDYLSRTRDH